ncbi:MAG: efflux RND transporter periplasmic adaptor subunit [Moraxellaceae bacterium]|nr:MAG: efflux RND transporter periplasmic adaptor subunit [Moraxellaceae bacterium]
MGFGLVLAGCQQKEAPAAPLRVVMVAQPATAELGRTSYSGEVRARQEADLSFRVAGKVTQRLVEVGSQVKKGQVLAVLDPTDANLQLNAAQAQLESSQSVERTAKTELERYRQLLPSNAISRSQFDQIENQYKTARSTVQQARANYDVVSNQAAYSTLRADKNGVVVTRHVEVGQVVNAGQPIYTLAMAGEREVIIGVPEQLVNQLSVRQPVQVSLWSNAEQLLPAYIREISPAADASRTFAVRVAFSNASAPVNIGQSARVFVTAANSNQQLSVPLAALTAESQNSYVLVFNPANSTLIKKPVRIGAYGRDSVPVLDGLNRQEWVVIGGVHLLQAGQKVRAVNRDNQPITSQGTSNQPASNQMPPVNASPIAAVKKD